MNNDAKIRGWKRYPVRKDGTKSYELPKRGDGSVNTDVATKFRPLPAGTSFEFDIHYHNLRKEELGALISAITFHNTSGLYHSLGSGKPLGYGKISLEITNLEESEKIGMLKSFEAFVNYGLGNSHPEWTKSLQLKELFAMARPGKDSILEYMNMGMSKDKSKENIMNFVEAKKNKLALKKYSSISGNNLEITSLITADELKEASEQYKEEKDIYEKSAGIEEVHEKKLNETKNRLQHALEEKKRELLDRLESRKRELRVEEAEARERAEEERIEQRRREREEEAERLAEQDLVFASCKFKDIQKTIKPYFENKEFELSAKQSLRLIEQLKCCWKEDNKTFYSKKKLTDFGRFPWSDIIRWLGEERAKNLYDELTR